MRRSGLPIGAPVIGLIPVLLLLAAGGFLAGCGGVALNAYDVRLEAASVQATAAEAALVARGAADGRSTRPFVRVRATELAQRAATEADLLASAQAPSGLDGHVRELTRLSRETAARLRRLAAASGDQALAARLRREFDSRAARARTLASP